MDVDTFVGIVGTHNDCFTRFDFDMDIIVFDNDDGTDDDDDGTDDDDVGTDDDDVGTDDDDDDDDSNKGSNIISIACTKAGLFNDDDKL